MVETACLARFLFLKMPWGKGASIQSHGLLRNRQWRSVLGALDGQPARLVVFSFGVGLLSAAMAMGTRNVLDPMVVQGTVSATGAFVVPLILPGVSPPLSWISVFQLGTGEIQKLPVWHCQVPSSPPWRSCSLTPLILAAIVGRLAGLLQNWWPA
ncbi:MAG: hypothetical protein R2864_01100 [Syntrophotaleaceae bacterium]